MGVVALNSILVILCEMLLRFQLKSINIIDLLGSYRGRVHGREGGLLLLG